MKLYCSANSPYARKARVVAFEVEVFDRIKFVDTDPRDPHSGFWDTNPLGKIPALVLDDGGTIYDSPVICEYLDETFGEGRLTGRGARASKVRTLTALADGIMDAGMAARLEGMRPAEEQSPSWVEKQLATVNRGFAELDRVVGQLESVSQASIAAACAVFWIGFRHPQRDWLDGRPALKEWFGRFGERPSMRRTGPEAGL